MKTLEEFLSSYYKNKRINEETENEETESTSENEIKQEKEKPAKEISSKYFFKNILFFTNERDSAKNKATGWGKYLSGREKWNHLLRSRLHLADV